MAPYTKRRKGYSYAMKGRMRKLYNVYKPRQFAQSVRRITYSIPEKKCYQVGAWNVMAATTDTPTDAGGSGAATQMDAAWHFFSLVNSIQQGTSVDKRIGNQIFIRYIQFSLLFEGDGDSLVNGMICRYCVIRNNEANGAIQGATAVFANGPTGTATFASIRRYDTKQKYTTLLDKQHATVNTTATTHNPNGIVHGYVGINRKLNYTGTTNDAAAGNLLEQDYFFAICASVANCCKTHIYWRVVFNDM